MISVFVIHATCPPGHIIGNIREDRLRLLLERREKTFCRLLTKGEPCHIKRSQYIYQGGTADTKKHIAEAQAALCRYPLQEVSEI